MQRTALNLAHRRAALTQVSEFFPCCMLSLGDFCVWVCGLLLHAMPGRCLCLGMWTNKSEATLIATSSCLQGTAAAADTVPHHQGRSTSEALGQEQDGDHGASREGSQNGAAAKPASEALDAPFQDLPEGIPDHAMGFKCALVHLKRYRTQNAEEGDQRGCLPIYTALTALFLLGHFPKIWTWWRLFHGTGLKIKG